MRFDIESIRFRGEAVHAENLLRQLGAEWAAKTPADPARVRRALMARSLLLSEGMAPNLYQVARTLAARFGIDEPIEIYQAAGAENASMHMVASPVLMEVQGRLLSLLDDDALAALLGHELGHYLAHGERNAACLAAHAVLQDGRAPPALLDAAQRLSMAQELTADRVGLIACSGLDAALRLEMVVVTGLCADTLGWDTQAYLEQSRALMEMALADGEIAEGSSHPEHSLRTWALWLFSESDVYCQITGLGSGARTLDEVDNILSRVLGNPVMELGQATVLDDTPIEMHECALAACVLVAMADGEFHDLEMQAIERIFAPLVPHWRDSLDPARALADFQRLAPVLSASGPRAQRALFSLLAHVLAVDGECSPDEVEVIIAIGEALACPKLFMTLLPPVLAHFGLALDAVEIRAGRGIPMPPRGVDVDEALDAYFQGVARRGGGRVSLRRLLRLLGEHRAEAASLARLTRMARRHDLQIDPVLGDDLDTVHRLDLLPGHAQPDIALPETPTEGSGDGRLRRALAHLRDKLISGDGRSPSIRLHLCRPGRALDLYDLEGVSTGLSERTLTLVRSARRARLLDAKEIDAHDTSKRLAQALVQLERARSTRFEETGADDLYLAYPFITGLAGGYLFRAPLILHPVRIERDRAGAISLGIPPEATPIANQSALRLIFHRKGRAYPDDLAEQADALAAQGPEALLAGLVGLGVICAPDRLRPLSHRAAELAQWLDDRLEIEECAVLGLFPQSNSDLLQDYDELLAALDRAEPPGKLLASAGEILPVDLRQSLLATAETDTNADVDANAQARAADMGAEAPPLIPVLYADPVQREVLAAARTATALVVDGPPGTGKSQVIVNLVADALARGEKVAVICEKRAALDVVAHRLDGVGLRHLLAVVHDVREDRRALYQQVTKRLESDEPHADDPAHRARLAAEIDEVTARLAQRAALTRITLAAQRPEGHQALALGQMHTYSAGLEGNAPCRIDTLAELPLARLDVLAARIGAIFPHAALWRPGSPWLDPEGARSRANLADYDNDRIRELTARLVAAREAATALEQALAAAGLSPDGEGHALLEHAAKGLAAALASRVQRTDERGAQAFVALLTDKTQADLIERTQAAWHALADSRAQRQRAPQARCFVELIAALVALPEGAQRLLACIRLWREHDVALDACADPVKFTVDPILAQALEELRRRMGNVTRFLSPAWWRARKTVRAGLAAQWTEMADAKLDRALLAGIDARAAAAQCWRAWADTLDWLAPAARPATLAEARAWLAIAAPLLAHAKSIAACRADMQALGAWRNAPEVDVIVDWDRAAPGWIDWFHRAQALREPATILAAERDALRALDAWPERWSAATIAAWDGRIDRLHAASQAMRALEAATQPIRAILPWAAQRPAAARLDPLLQAWQRDARHLIDADRQLAAAQAIASTAVLFPKPLAENDTHGSTDAWADGVRKTWTSASIAAIEKDHGDLSTLDRLAGTRLAAEEARLAALHDEERRLAIRRILARQDDAPLLRAPPAAKGARRSPEQAVREAMLREAGKQRNILPLRGFVRRFLERGGLLDVLPVWLLSPETATLLFPRAPIFDLVIIDEASQCTVEDGLPVLMRARRAVIAGDERQMPPSNFFKAGESGGEESEESEESEATAEETDNAGEKPGNASRAAREMFDAESLLVLARHRVPRLGLAWHYRCRHEELIAFSNHAIYGGALRTIPSTLSRLAPAAIHWLDVVEGRYENGINLPEARAVIDLVDRLLQQSGHPSIGVVTFNLGQRRAVLDEIDRRISDDPAFAEHWTRAQAAPRIDDRPFVKNLESVQGDERDIIIFSLGHAPIERKRRDGQMKTYVPARFGPLGQRGGERRLNVAVSRARQEIFIVASFDPHMLSVARSKHDGPRLFKSFLLFASQLAAGQRNQAEQTLKMAGTLENAAHDGSEHGMPPPASWVPLNAQLALALEARGIQCELNVGTSAFRVPLAIVDPAHPRHYQFGIMFDEVVPADGVFERHRHIPDVLAGRGWKLLYFSSREWDTDRERVLAEICAFKAENARLTNAEASVDMDMDASAGKDEKVGNVQG
ncbi:MAG: DUF4011 domain-containing protein [Azoarcus sp.]|jgi:tellurite resistance protein|nr:DUF4011 domain-containing protein [Azoarcus sp.]